MQRKRKFAGHHKDWKGLNTVVSTKITDAEFMALRAWMERAGLGKSDALRQAIRQAAQAAGRVAS